MQATPPVRCVGVTKFYAGVQALGDVSVELNAGECVCLVGDNGAGKSTLVEDPVWDHGSGQRRGSDRRPAGYAEPPSGPPARDRGRLPGSRALRHARRGRERHARPGADQVQARSAPVHRLEGRHPGRDTQKIKEIGIDLDDPNMPVRRLSGGQRQAIAIARATVRGHRMVIFDEPTAALGVRQTKTTLELVRRVADQGVAVVMISHNLDDVFSVADRIVALRLGRGDARRPPPRHVSRGGGRVHDGDLAGDAEVAESERVSMRSRRVTGFRRRFASRAATSACSRHS